MLDLVSLCKARRIPFLEGGHRHCVRGWVQLHCPLCGGGRDGWHLGFNLTSGALACWRCGKLRFWDVVPLLLRASRAEAQQLVAKYQTRRAPSRTIGPKEVIEVRLPPGTGPLQPVHRRYLRDRGLDPDVLASDWDLLATDWQAGARWAWRIIIPIYDSDGRLVTYTGRAVGDAEPKYQTQAEDEAAKPAKHQLYGAQHAPRGPASPVIVSEGPFDVFALGRGAVATLGTAWTTEQAAEIAQYGRRFICFDPEPLAQRRARELAAWLAPFPGTTEIVEGLSSDPGSLPETDLRLLRGMLAG